ncbi:MAG: phospholipase [Planctomycetota bacterium]
MASPAPIDISAQLLRTLHRIHKQKADLAGQLRRCPLQIQAIQSSVDQAKADVEAVAEELKKTRLTCDEKQLQLQSREDHVEQLQAKLNTAATNKEFSLLKDQIAADEQANSVQNDEIFEVLERIDAVELKLQAAQQTLFDQEAEAADRWKVIEARMDDLRQDLARVEDQLQAAEKEIPSAMRSDYERIIVSRGEEALAPIESGSCGHCYQTLTAQLIDQVHLSKLVRCPNCNAFLYLPEDTRVR